MMEKAMMEKAVTEKTMTENSQQAFEFLRSGDADGVRRLLEQDPAASEARDPNGVSLLMQSLYRGHRDLAELIASKKKSLDIFEATALGRLADLRDRIRDEASVINSRSRD